MRRFRSFFVPLAGLLLGACAAPPFQPTEERFAAHVTWLADDARGGRGTGTEGYDAAVAYVEAAFAAVGLEPLGDGGTWRQDFTASGPRRLAEGNRLEIAGQVLELEREWLPFGSAASGQLQGEVVFAGYGLADPGDAEAGVAAIDDYAGLDVAGKVVLVLRHGPPESASGGRWVSGKGQRYVTTAAKINEAYKRGAAGIVIANDPRSHGAGGAADVPVPYRGGATGAVASIPAVSLSAAAGQRVFGALGLDLGAEQAALDHALTPRSRAVGGASLAVAVAAELSEVPSCNVLARLPGTDPALAGEYVLVGAHLDHLGLGGSGSLGGATAGAEIHNGADDNASGIAGLLEIARSLSDRPKKPARAIVFAAFGAEEWGLLGSRHYVAQPALPLAGCVAMLNMDMIGRSGTGRVEVGGVGTAAELPGLLDAALDEVDGLHAEHSASVTGNSDHAPFLEARVPVLSLFTGLHSEYHTPADDTPTLDMAGGARVAALGGALVRRLADLPARPAFTDPAPAQSQTASVDPHQGQTVVGYGVSFGSRPDMTYAAEDGVRVASVREGSPAERCGLRTGDVIVALDGTAIRNLEDYSVLLFSHRPGDEIKVTVRRDGAELVLVALLEAPAGGT